MVELPAFRASFVSGEKVTVDEVWQIGLHSLRSNRDEHAAELFRHVVRRDPRHADAHYNLGVLATLRHDHAEAALRYQILRRIDLDYARLLRDHFPERH